MTDAMAKARARENARFFAIAKAYNFSDDERHELATMVTGREITSFTQLDARELATLNVGLRVAAYVFHLLRLRPKRVKAPNA